MDEDFQLTVMYKGKEWSFTGRLLQFGYTYKIEVEVEDIKLHFERDDSGDWRALLSQQDLEQNKTIDRHLIEAILASIEQITS